MNNISKKFILSLTLVGTMLTTSVYPFWGAAKPTPGFFESAAYIASKVINKPFKKWSKFEKAWPVIGGILATLFISTFIKGPLNKIRDESVKAIPEKIRIWPFKYEMPLDGIKWLLQDKDAKDEATFYEKTKPKKTLNDIVGGKLHQELTNILEDIKNGFEIEPILIHGPKGNGKTTEAEVFASEVAKIKDTEVVLLKTSGAAFLSKYVGESPKKVNELLKKAKDISPKERGMIRRGLDLIFRKKSVVIIIDELLSIATGTSGESNHGWATVEALQTSVDNLFPSKEIFLIATSNSTDIPPATLDRFETIYFPETSLEQKIATLEFHINIFSKQYLKVEYGKLSESCRKELTEMIKDNHDLSLRGMKRISRMAASLATRAKQTKISDDNLISAAKVVIERASENDKSKDYTRYSTDGRNTRNKKTEQEQIQKATTRTNAVPTNLLQEVLKMNRQKATTSTFVAQALSKNSTEENVPKLFESTKTRSSNKNTLLNLLKEENTGGATASKIAI